MIIMTEEQATEKARKLLELVEESGIFEDLTEGEAMTVLATYIYLLGVESGIEAEKGDDQ
ncbi:hypothetical protein LCGC14_1020420 [marine sediment metagenome]|uniref:Uncharacterized protein n=1 Tax=marine sediment metagenome TaxID=412755 RepID=A0A0F9NJ62_9ZZZZ